MALSDTLNQFMFGGMDLGNDVQFYAVSKDGYALEGAVTQSLADEANVVTGDMI